MSKPNPNRVALRTLLTDSLGFVGNFQRFKGVYGVTTQAELDAFVVSCSHILQDVSRRARIRQAFLVHARIDDLSVMVERIRKSLSRTNDAQYSLMELELSILIIKTRQMLILMETLLPIEEQLRAAA